MLKAVTRKEEIAKCQRSLVASLKKALPNCERLMIGHQGGSGEHMIYYGKDLWFSTQVLKEGSVQRYWNAFGREIRERGNQFIIVEINPPIKGSMGTGALFAKDEPTNKYFLLHRGRVGGGRKGIGKAGFRYWYRGAWVSVYDENGKVDDAILVGTLGAKDLVNQIREFVREVSKFKDEVASGKQSRVQEAKDKSLTFDPESYGKISGRRRSRFEYEAYHGLIVNALEQRLRAEGAMGNGSVFNTRMIDLGIQVAGHTRHIFEVKCSSDNQSIYIGIGQLMFHSRGSRNIKKTLVLPEGEYLQDFFNILGQVGIDILKYEIHDGQVTFTT